VAVAGPAVNVVIAAMLFALIAPLGDVATMNQATIGAGSFLNRLMWTNVALAVFNMIPAFPMDGGRVLRALLARRLHYIQATQIAAGIGQALAIGFGILGLVFNPLLLLVALFVYIGAGQETRVVQTQELLKDALAPSAMMTRYRVLSRDATLGEAANELLAGAQQDFPVVDEGKLVGILPRSELIQALAESGPEMHVSEAMKSDCDRVEEAETLEHVLERLRSGASSSLPVVRNGQLIGVVTLENIGDWMMVRSALEHSESPRNMEEVTGV
jgi:CBS domain-containing protein